MELRYFDKEQALFTKDQFFDLMIPALPDGGYLEDMWSKLPIVNVPYDSEAETLKHIRRVNELLIHAAAELLNRAAIHDKSKLSEVEKAHFDRLTPLLRDTEYGSERYFEFIRELGPALDHHYSQNPHHPEYYPQGVDDMNLFDILEMFMDWKAAGERHETGCIYQSIRQNQHRFKISGQLANIFYNTARFLHWPKRSFGNEK